MRGLCVIVFGISGVGKTTECEAYIGQHPDWMHVSASQLLREATNVSNEDLRTASADGIRANQQLLGEMLTKHRLGRESRPILIDAHAVIDNDRQLVRVPIEAVRSLSPDGMILLEAPASLIAQRRLTGRHRPQRSIADIRRELSAERQTVRRYAKELRVPLQEGEATGSLTLDRLLKAIVKDAPFGSD